MSSILEQMQKDLYDGKGEEVEAATRQALDEGMSAQPGLGSFVAGREG